MEALKLFDKKGAPLDWDYDGDADTLYISFGKPKTTLVSMWARVSLPIR